VNTTCVPTSAPDSLIARLSARRLLQPYWAAPFLLLLVLSDKLTGSLLRTALDQGLAPSLQAYALLFGMPHVLASFFGFADPVLVRPTWRWLALCAACAAAASALAAWLLEDLTMYALMVVATMIHVMGQQTGLAAGQTGLRVARYPAALKLWRTLLAVAATSAAVAVGGELMVPLTPDSAQWFVTGGVGLLLSLPLAAWLGYQAHATGGSAHALVAIQLTAVVAYVMVAMGYALLGIGLIRWVHDATAFMIYGGLAQARASKDANANRLFRIFGLSAKALSWSLWPLAIVLCWILLPLFTPYASVWLVLTHYLCEHRLWRRSSAWRRHLRLG
jgi:hypothetical protein